ncbi:MAG TPA: dUTP diphosphatase [Telmatospirillum sp.]|nr:dUTP diphosphatase [Telmatospirillum sp.]
MAEVSVQIERLAHAQDLPLPRYETEQAAGLDLLAAVEAAVTLAPGAFTLIPTGIKIALPADHEAQIRPRSGLAAKNGVTVLNSPGTIDADYRGEIKVILINHGPVAFVVSRGLRIAQMVIAPVARARWTECQALPESVRGSGGFGSTGVGAPS